MLTVQQIRDMIVTSPSGAGGFGGRHEAERRFGKNTSPHQLDLIRDLAGQKVGALRTHRHPAREAGVSAPPRQPVPLTPSDVAWINRLGSPDEVTFSDAVQLAKLAVRVERGGGDQRLVDSVWLPVRARHDRLDAEAVVANARQDWPAVPRDVARAAMLAAVEADPEAGPLTERERAARAERLLDEAVEARDTARREQIEQADRALADTDRARAERESINAA